MNRVVLLHFSGSVSEQFELVGMRPHVLTYEKPPSFNEFVARVRAVMNVGCDVRLHGCMLGLFFCIWMTTYTFLF
jgi:hypothetical protein